MSNTNTNGNEALAAANNMAAEMSSTGERNLGFNLVTFDPTTAEGAALLIAACLRKPLNLKEHANQAIRLKHIVQHNVETVDEHGEVENWQRTVLIDENGTCYQCGSEGVEKALRIFRLVRGDKLPFDPPVICTVKLESLDGNRQWMYLDPDMKSLSALPGKRK